MTFLYCISYTVCFIRLRWNRGTKTKLLGSIKDKSNYRWTRAILPSNQKKAQDIWCIVSNSFSLYEGKVNSVHRIFTKHFPNIFFTACNAHLHAATKVLHSCLFSAFFLTVHHVTPIFSSVLLTTVLPHFFLGLPCFLLPSSVQCNAPCIAILVLWRALKKEIMNCFQGCNNSYASVFQATVLYGR